MSSHAAEHGHADAHHMITHDTVKAANMGVFLGTVSFTFFSATAVACNVYLRSWSHDQFTLADRALKDLPYLDTLTLIVAGLLLLLAGRFFRTKSWRKFNVTMALAVPLYLIIGDVQYWIIDALSKQNSQIQTAYMGPALIEFALTVLSFILLVRVNWITREKLKTYFPICMNVWLYTIASSIIMLLITDVVNFGDMAAWCGTKLSSIASLGGK
ncbi:MAG: hypothetical protein JWN30_1653 [Bacilli bacterium]|nr:hypothetical protein [Bacilli bacterium]